MSNPAVEPIAVFGAGGFLLQILPMLDEVRAMGRHVVVVDDRSLPDVFGYPVVPLNAAPADAVFAVAVADGSTRARIVERIAEHRFASIIAASSTVSPHATMADGGIICSHVTIEAGSRIGRHFHGNIYSYVAHECFIGDFVTFAPRVSCNGNVYIDDYAYIGTGAIIRNGTPEKPLVIGKRAVIGMGAVVTKDVPDDTVVMGNPARIRRSA